MQSLFHCDHTNLFLCCLWKNKTKQNQQKNLKPTVSIVLSLSSNLQNRHWLYKHLSLFQLMFWVKKQFSSGIKKHMLLKAKASFLTRWRSLLSGCKMLKKVWLCLKKYGSLLANQMWAFFQIWVVLGYEVCRLGMESSRHVSSMLFAVMLKPKTFAAC